MKESWFYYASGSGVTAGVFIRGKKRAARVTAPEGSGEAISYSQTYLQSSSRRIMMHLRGRLLRPDSRKRVSGIPGVVHIDGGSADVDFSDCAFYPTYTPNVDCTTPFKPPFLGDTLILNSNNNALI
jgi:hypothetical protein